MKKNVGQPKKYKDPVEIRIRCDRSFRDKLDNYLKGNKIRDRNKWLIDEIEKLMVNKR
jgi:hypothetical protein